MRFPVLGPLLLTLLTLLAAPALGSEKSPPLEEVLRALESPFQADGRSEIVDFEADFLQESRLATLDRVQRGEGKVAVRFDRRAGEGQTRAMFRWDYRRPTEQEIVSDGKTLWVYIPENRQVIRSELEPASESRPDDPLTFLTGLGNLSRDFHVAWGDPRRDEGGNFILELRPRRPTPTIERLRLVVNREALEARSGEAVFPLRSTTVYDPAGNSTLIAFREVRTNRDLPTSLFDFTPPEGVETIRPTGDGMGL